MGKEKVKNKDDTHYKTRQSNPIVLRKAKTECNRVNGVLAFLSAIGLSQEVSSFLTDGPEAIFNTCTKR